MIQYVVRLIDAASIIPRRRRAPNSLHWRCQALLLQCLIVVTLGGVGIQSVSLEVGNNVLDQEGSHQRPLSRREVAAVAYSSSHLPSCCLMPALLSPPRAFARPGEVIVPNLLGRQHARVDGYLVETTREKALQVSRS